jgi:hypothetical protein
MKAAKHGLVVPIGNPKQVKGRFLTLQPNMFARVTILSSDRLIGYIFDFWLLT